MCLKFGTIEEMDDRNSDRTHDENGERSISPQWGSDEEESPQHPTDEEPEPGCVAASDDGVARYDRRVIIEGWSLISRNIALLNTTTVAD